MRNRCAANTLRGWSSALCRWRAVLSACGLAVICALPAGASPVETAPAAGAAPLSGPGVLTVTFADGQVVVLDRAGLEAMPQQEVQTTTIWTEGVQDFSGVPMTELIRAYGADGTTAILTAVNGYEIRIPLDQETLKGAVLALMRNGRPMSLRDKGPLWLVYPYDSDPAYRTEVVYANSIWQLDHISFTR
ncbi:oxidoreductase [Pseudooceanicola nanhaiensis]|uniref:oxidoreductase n=1 Tax=Pseudooceanicola nanhaiensis TaxID=375761 RepID=UPI001CD70A46|nr:oxidoreductase [Pseudooceanicola nanhaiensis]MCA0921672.1 oxidoreductase [Pseudooceanicola nanhaiensis]